jgi:hypothetical protein
MRTVSACAVLFTQTCLLLAASAPADEIDALVEKVKPPARFRDRQALILGFVCLGPGTAYFDDFSLIQVKEDERR